MTKPALGIVCRNLEQRLTDGFLQCFARTSPDAAQIGLQLGKGFFNRGKVGRIAWQKENLTFPGLDQVNHFLAFMGRQVIHNDDLTSRQAGSQDLFHILFKSSSIG